MVKQELEDIGRRIIGQGAEVEFGRKVREREEAGMSPEDAQKTVFEKAMTNVLEELRLTGPLAPESKAFGEFRAALKEVFGKDIISNFKQDARDPAKWRALSLSPPDQRQKDAMAEYYRRRFNLKDRKDMPEEFFIEDGCKNMKLLAELLRRMLADPALGASGDLKTLIASHPEIGADLGKIVLSKELLELQERKFGGERSWNQAREKWKKDARETLTEMKLGFLHSGKMMGDAIFSSDISLADLPKKFHRFAAGFTQFFAKPAWAGSKFLMKSIGPGIKWLKTR